MHGNVIFGSGFLSLQGVCVVMTMRKILKKYRFLLLFMASAEKYIGKAKDGISSFIYKDGDNLDMGLVFCQGWMRFVLQKLVTCLTVSLNLKLNVAVAIVNLHDGLRNVLQIFVALFIDACLGYRWALIVSSVLYSAVRTFPFSTLVAIVEGLFPESQVDTMNPEAVDGNTGGGSFPIVAFQLFQWISEYGVYKWILVDSAILFPRHNGRIAGGRIADFFSHYMQEPRRYSPMFTRTLAGFGTILDIGFIATIDYYSRLRYKESWLGDSLNQSRLDSIYRAYVSSLLNNAAVKDSVADNNLPTGKQRWRVCTVKEEQTELLLDIIPLSATFILYDVVISLGNTFLAEQADSMREDTPIVHLQFTTKLSVNGGLEGYFQGAREEMQLIREISGYNGRMLHSSFLQLVLEEINEVEGGGCSVY
ncbi:Major facilitator superfamily protein isoform 2 [Hibiscus syriacus]|uniref:Major facilitator superfamily protein isoform 2 n=1 Tax=Hibiscus syriacus TaxID=106335 RepID=A0A6A2X4Y3_HIBSY|nr:Major facilitator superfamily protein isoform 2 [Hibiscus syriacus]